MPSATHSQVHPDPSAAREEVELLLAAGTPTSDIQMLTGRLERNIRHESIGGFAGPIAPDAPIGTFGGTTRLRNQPVGAWAGDPSSQRQGSFGDAEHDKVVTFDRGREVSRTVDRRALRRLLQPVAGDPAHADKLIAELHQGRALLLIAHAQTASRGAHAEPEYALQAA